MSFTVTATAGSPFLNGILLRIKVLTSAAATQSGATATAAAAYQKAITTTAAGSIVYGALTDDGVFTANASTTLSDNFAGSTGTRLGSCRQTTPTGTPGSVTIGATASGPDGGVALLEILAAGTIAEDASGPAAASSTTLTAITSASFTPPAGSLLVVMASALASSMAITDTSGLGLTWTQKSAMTTDGYAGVWIAQMPGGGTPVSLAESGSGSEAGSVAAAVPLAESGTAASSLTLAAAISLAESGSASESLLAGLAKSLAEAGAGSESLVSGLTAPLAESGTGSEALAAAAAVPLAESGTGTSALALISAVPLSDAGAGAESLAVSSAVAWLSFDPVLSRVLVSLSSLRTVIGSDDTAAIQRSPDQVQWTTVRGGTDVAVTSAARDLPDYEFTPDVVNYYRAVRSGGGIRTLSIVTLLGDSPWIKNLRYPFLNMAVKLSDAGDITRAANGSAFLPVGDSFPVAVPVVRGGRQFTLTVETDSDAGTASLDALLSTGDVLLLQVPAAYPVPAIGGYYYAGDTAETRNGVPWAMRWTDLALTEAVPPSPDVTPITSTWATLVSDYATWADVAAGLATWDDVVSLVGAPPDVVIS